MLNCDAFQIGRQKNNSTIGQIKRTVYNILQIESKVRAGGKSVKELNVDGTIA
ncbi:30S ribosomal protein S16 chloroplastic, partial [Dissostichus eleginoides]